MSLRTRLLLFVAAPLAVVGVLVAVALVWWRWDAGRAPTLGNDIPAMDQAIAATVTAAGDQTPVAISGVFAGSACDLGPLHRGGRFTRSADLYTARGQEDSLIDQIAAALPPTYRPRRGTSVGGNAAPLTATAGAGVELSVDQISPGWVVARARTGCSSGTAAADNVGDIADMPGGATVNRLLAALGTGAAQSHRHPLGCPGGIATLAVVSRPTTATDLTKRLATLVPADGRQISTRSNRLAYRAGGVSVVVAASDDNTAVTLQYTGPC